MKNSHLMGAICACVFCLLTPASNAAIVNPMLGLDIDGTLYDVTFHDFNVLSFNSLWDADDDGVFGGGGSVFSAAPMFWDDQVGAELARDEIIARLGLVDFTIAGSDLFIIPYGAYMSSTISAGFDFIEIVLENHIASDDDNPTAGILADSETGSPTTFASFTLASPVPVPVPGAVWLFGSGLLGLIGIARRNKA